MPQPRKIVDYTVVIQNSVELLNTYVCTRIEDGWIPLGGVSADQGHLFQAMVKYK